MRATFVWGLLLVLGCSDERRDDARPSATTHAHVAIAGTRVALAPPMGFAPSERVQGLERAAGAAKVGVFELPVGLAEALPDARESWAASGFELASEAAIALDGQPGRLFEYRRAERGAARRGWLAIGGDDVETLLLLAECDATAHGELAAPLRECLLGVRWRRSTAATPELVLQPVDGLVLVADDENGKAYVAAGAPSPIPAGTPFLLAAVHAEVLDAKALEEACRQRLVSALATVDASVTILERSERIELGPLYGWELVARVRDPRAPGDWLGYALLVPHAAGHALVLGHASPSESRRALELFERTARTLRLR